MYKDHSRAPNLINNVADWKNILIDGEGGNAGLVIAQGRPLELPFDKVGTFFVENLLGISSTDKLARDPVFLVGAAMAYIKCKSPDELYQAFAAKIHPDLVKELRTAIDLKTKEQIKSSCRTLIPPAHHRSSRGTDQEIPPE